MSLSIVKTRASLGIDAPQVSVETHISNGLPSLAIVGLPETAVKESKERVRSALINSGFEFPSRRITINLAPADLPKQGGRYDLAIALSVLAASHQLDNRQLDKYEFLGELSLTGELRAVSGVLPSVIAIGAHGRQAIVPSGNASEASIAEDVEVYSGAHLSEVCAHLTGKAVIQPLVRLGGDSLSSESSPDLHDVKGQMMPRRALEIAAAGGLNLLLYGPPGTGKSMLASRLPSIMPLLDKDEALEVASVYSIKGAFDEAKFRKRPFRSPHHSASAAALIGGVRSNKN